MLEVIESLDTRSISDATVDDFWAGGTAEFDHPCSESDLRLLLDAIDLASGASQASTAQSSDAAGDSIWSILSEAGINSRAVALVIHGKFNDADPKIASLAISAYLSLLTTAGAVSRILHPLVLRSALTAVHKLVAGSAPAVKDAKRGKKRRVVDATMEATFGDDAGEDEPSAEADSETCHELLRRLARVLETTMLSSAGDEAWSHCVEVSLPCACAFRPFDLTHAVQRHATRTLHARTRTPPGAGGDGPTQGDHRPPRPHLQLPRRMLRRRPGCGQKKKKRRCTEVTERCYWQSVTAATSVVINRRGEEAIPRRRQERASAAPAADRRLACRRAGRDPQILGRHDRCETSKPDPSHCVRARVDARARVCGGEVSRHFWPGSPKKTKKILSDEAGQISHRTDLPSASDESRVMA